MHHCLKEIRWLIASLKRNFHSCFIVIPISLLEITGELINRFITAAYTGDVSKVKEMLDVGVPVDSEDEIGRTALECAVVYHKTDVTQLLLSRGADVNKRSGLHHQTALHKAASNNSTDVIEVLLKHGAWTNIKDRFGDTPIDLARSKNNEAAVRLLERH